MHMQGGMYPMMHVCMQRLARAATGSWLSAGSKQARCHAGNAFGLFSACSWLAMALQSYAVQTGQATSQRILKEAASSIPYTVPSTPAPPKPA